MTSRMHPLKILAMRLAIPFEVQERLYNHYSIEDLALFVSDELGGVNVDRQYAELAGHLDACETCLQAYVDLSELAARSLFLQDSP